MTTSLTQDVAVALRYLASEQKAKQNLGRQAMYQENPFSFAVTLEERRAIVRRIVAPYGDLTVESVVYSRIIRRTE